MAVSVTVNSINVNVNGTRFINFADGAQLEFGSLSEIEAAVLSIDTPENIQHARELLLRHWLAMDPTAMNTSYLVGRRLTFDMTQVQPIVVEDV